MDRIVKYINSENTWVGAWRQGLEGGEVEWEAIVL